MMVLKNALFPVLALFLCSCAFTRVSSGLNRPPAKSFVKVLHFTTVTSCGSKKDPRCKLGTFGQTGSGMAVSVFKDEMTVLTAGHVCNSQPDPEIIDKHLQHIHVIDHTNTKHQAWPVHVSFDNQASSADLCLLYVPTLDVKKARIGVLTPKVGDELYYIGSPLGIHHPPTVPIFKGVYSGKISASSAIVTFPAIGGSSGAAVFDKNNRIVGVVFAANVAFHHVSLVTTHESLKMFINQAKSRLSDTLQ